MLAEAGHALENAVEAHVVALKLVELYDSHHDDLRLAAVDAEQAVAHHVGAGVDSHDDALIPELAAYAVGHSSGSDLRIDGK